MLIYNKYGKPYNIKLPITIIGSSSSGNSVRFDKIKTLVDIGLPYSHYPKDFFYQVRYVALTHEHPDHLNHSTLKHIVEIYPNTKFIVSKRLYDFIKNHEILKYEDFEKFTSRSKIFQPQDKVLLQMEGF